MKTRHNFTLNQETVNRLRELADKNGISMSAMLEVIIREKATTTDRWIRQEKPIAPKK